MDAAGIDPRLFNALIIMSVITLPIKGMALWRAVRSNSKGWFITLLLLNSVGILDLVYLFYLSKPEGESAKS